MRCGRRRAARPPPDSPPLPPTPGPGARRWCGERRPRRSGGLPGRVRLRPHVRVQAAGSDGEATAPARSGVRAPAFRVTGGRARPPRSALGATAGAKMPRPAQEATARLRLLRGTERQPRPQRPSRACTRAVGVLGCAPPAPDAVGVLGCAPPAPVPRHGAHPWAPDHGLLTMAWAPDHAGAPRSARRPWSARRTGGRWACRSTMICARPGAGGAAARRRRHAARPETRAAGPSRVRAVLATRGRLSGPPLCPLTRSPVAGARWRGRG